MNPNEVSALDNEIRALQSAQQQKLQESNELLGRDGSKAAPVPQEQGRPPAHVSTGISDEEFGELDSAISSMQQQSQQNTDFVNPDQEMSDDDFNSINNMISPEAPKLQSADEAQRSHRVSAVELLQAARKGVSIAAGGISHGVQTSGEAIAQSTLKAGNVLGMVDDSTVSGYTSFAKAKQALRESELGKGAGVGEFVGKLLPYLIPGPVGKGGLMRQGATQAADMAVRTPISTFTDEGGSELSESVVGAALGAAPAAVIGAVKGAGAVKNAIMPGKKAAQQSMIDVVEASGQTADDLARGVAEGEKQGVKLTTGEALNNPALLAKEGQIATSPERQARVIGELKNRNSTALRAVGEEMNTILPQGIATAKKEATAQFTKMADVQLPKEQVQAALKDPIVLNQYNQVMKNADWKASHYGEDSIGRLHETIQYINNKIDRSEGAVNKNLIEAKQKLLTTIEQNAPEYRQFLDLEQRVILKKKYVQLLRNELSPLKGADKVSAAQVYNSFFKDNTATRDIIKSLNRQGQDTSGIKATTRILNRLNNSKIDKLVTKNPEFNASLAGGLDPIHRIGTTVDNVLRGRYYDELLELSLNPKYAEEVLRASRIHDPAELTKAMLDLFKQVTPKAAAAADDTGE
jgi:hypothetical protein